MCFNPTFIWWGCKAPPGWRSIEELGEHHRLVNSLQRITVHSVTTHDFQCMQGLGALLRTSRTWSLTDTWLVSVAPSIRIDVARRISGNSGGRHGCILRLLSVKMTSTVLAQLSFKLLAWPTARRARVHQLWFGHCKLELQRKCRRHICEPGARFSKNLRKILRKSYEVLKTYENLRKNLRQCWFSKNLKKNLRKS